MRPLSLLLCLAASSAQAQASIRATAWNDHAYTFDDVRSESDRDRYEITMEGGRAANVTVNGEARPIDVSVHQIDYGDYFGDRREEAVVVLTMREQMPSHVWEAAFVLLFRERSNAPFLVDAERVRPPERVVVARRMIEVSARRGLPGVPYPCTVRFDITESALVVQRERCR